MTAGNGSMDKSARYGEAIRELEALLEGETDLISRMATVCSVLMSHLPHASWVGFYRVVAPEMLAVGPFQGGIGCLRIPFGRGVCGAAARTQATQVVEDVRSFPGHIACDEAARSEIVVPIRDREGRVIAVLDLDSRDPAAFDEVDRARLERIAALVLPEAPG
jgi:L-methionine (R)-S-oxide reductase